MPETLQTNYQAFSDMEQEGATVPWKKFYVYLAGKTNNAHRDFVARFKRTGQTEVDSPESSDYILVFCPIVSRVGTDIGEALESAEKNNPGGKPIILVVMHHTFNPDHVIAESRRLVKNPNVRLTVDCLIYEGKLLTCNRNDIALYDVQKIFGTSPTQDSGCSDCSGWVRAHRRAFFIFFCILCIMIAVLVILLIMFMPPTKKTQTPNQTNINPYGSNSG
ncbi:hypothetical protein D5F01_LYC14462 [Larimichthys crocea]|uniref:Uncharacterized protein n=1 Tax=Larimichthys crocea TaxID=215358 RepID=A0A6G0I597_LARCR|nr:hypothetical protein D5F01_LYC14462 [Larimichthys crocea]